MENMEVLKSKKHKKPPAKDKIPFASRHQSQFEQQDITEYVTLIKRYASSITTKRYIVKHYQDEIESFGMYSLFKHLRLHDPARGTFTSFLINIYKNMYAFAIKLEKNINITSSFDDFSYYISSDDDNVELKDTLDLDTVESKLMAHQILSSLNDEERKIMIDRFYYDRTLEEIAQDYHVTRERIRQRVEKIVNKIRKRFRINVTV